MSGAITFTGIGSGTDMAAIVDALVEVERYRINNLETWKTEWENKIESIQGLNSRLASYESAVNEINRESEFMATLASSSDTDVVTATSSSTAIPGTYNLNVDTIWDYRKTITITNDSDSDLTTHLIRIDENVLDSDFWTDVESDYRSLRFYRGDTQLDFYVQNWNYVGGDPPTSTCDIWVQVDSIDANGEEIQMYYGNSDATAANTADIKTLKKGWTEASGIKGGLWHFDDSVSDASSNGNDGTVTGATTYNAEDVAWVEDQQDPPDFGKSFSFDGATRINVSDTSDSLDMSTSFTISTWIKTADTDAALMSRNSADFTIGSENNTIDFKEVPTITITTGSNDKIDFKEDDAYYVATLSQNTYTCTQMATEIQTQLNNQSVDKDYTVTYSAVTNKFTISKATDSVDLLWNSGANASQSPKTLLGYDDENDTESLSYSSDQTLISSELTVTIESGNWTSAELCTKIENALEAATVNSADYTVSYDGGTDKFTIQSASGLTELQLLWNTGTNAGDSPRELLGNDDADDTGATSHESDNKVTPQKIFSMDIATNNAYFTMHTSDGSKVTLDSATDVRDSAWHQVTVTVDAGDGTNGVAKIYVNGVEKDSTSFTGNLLTSDKDMVMGAELDIDDANPANYYTGLMDETMLVGRAYTATEVDAEYDHITTEFDSGTGADAPAEISIGSEASLGALAKAETDIHTGVAASTTVINDSGSDKVFAYRYAGGDTVTVTVADDTTLAGLVNLINSDSSNPGVTASVLNDGLDNDTSYHLVLTGDDTGKANYIMIDDVATTLDGTDSTTNFESSTFTESQAAENAQLKINDYGIERASNTITDVVEGVTFSLKDTGTATVTVDWNVTTIKQNIAQLVSSHNFVIDYIKNQTEYDEDTEEAGVMIGNYSFLIVKNRLNDILYTPIPGLADGIDTYTTLAEIGIKTDPHDVGKWKIDDTVLSQAMVNDLQAVKRLFILNTDRTVGGPTRSLSEWTGTATLGSSGTYTESSDATYTFTVDDAGTFTLGTNQFDISWTSTDGGSGSFTVATGDVGVAQDIGETSGDGKGIYVTLSGNGNTVVAGDTFEIKAFPSGLPGAAELLYQELYDLTDSIDGPMNVLLDSYEGIIDNIDLKIEKEERRVALVEDRLIMQFARLEAMLTILAGQETYLQSLIDQLPQIGGKN